MHRLQSTDMTDMALARTFRRYSTAVLSALALAAAGAGLGAVAPASAAPMVAKSYSSAMKSPRDDPSYAMITGDQFKWILPLENEANYDPGEQDVEESSYLPLYFVGRGTSTGIDYRLSIGKKPVYSDGDTTVTIDLNSDFTWADGQKVTSADVKFFFQLLAVGKHTMGEYVPGEMPTDITSITCPRPYEVVLHLEHAYNPTWFTGNQLTWIYPLPAQSWDRTCANCPVGNAATTPSGAAKVFKFLFSQAGDLSTYATNPLWKAVDGPFEISAYDPVTFHASFTANAHYTGPTKPHIAGFRIYTFTTATAELDSLRSGTLTFGELPLSDVSEASYFKSHGYTVKAWKLFYNEDIEFGYTSKTWGPLVKQLYIRQSLQHLVTEKLYITKTLRGYGIPDFGVVADYPGSKYVSPALRKDPYPYSPSAAERLLTEHGWKRGSNGVDVCERPGTGPRDCGAGIAKEESLGMPFMYQSGTTSFLAEVSAFQTAARRVGVAITLEGESITTLYSIAGVCPTSPCRYGLAGYSGFMWNYGQYQSVPSGDDQFGKGNFFGGGYYTAKAQQLIKATEVKPGLKALYADEDYLSKDVASLWWPLEDYVVVAKDTLKGWQLSPYGTVLPMEWRISG